MTNFDIQPSRIKIGFHKSSTKDGGWGFDCELLEGYDEAEADRVMAGAKRLRDEAIEALKPPPLEQQLEQSIAAAGAVK